MTLAETSFTDAKIDFKIFLEKNSLPSDIVWLFYEDIISLNTKFYDLRLWIKMPSVLENEQIAEKCYIYGRQRGLGVCLSAFTLVESKIGCCIILPKDEEDSNYLFMSPLHVKYSCISDIPKAEIVKSNLIWYFRKNLSFKYRKGCFLDYLPTKRNLLPR
jgi:hypothetical protein